MARRVRRDSPRTARGHAAPNTMSFAAIEYSVEVSRMDRRNAMRFPTPLTAARSRSPSMAIEWEASTPHLHVTEFASTCSGSARDPPRHIAAIGGSTTSGEGGSYRSGCQPETASLTDPPRYALTLRRGVRFSTGDSLPSRTDTNPTARGTPHQGFQIGLARSGEVKRLEKNDLGLGICGGTM